MIDAYKEAAGEEAIDQLKELADRLRGIKITHVNSTQKGGGVAEILLTMVPLTQALGMDVEWKVIQGSQDFFQCTKMFHNTMQGQKGLLSPSQLQVYESTNQVNAEALRKRLEESDVVIIHDPQPASLITHFSQRKGKWVWRCHIDASKPYWPVWKYLRQFVAQYDASIFSLIDFTQALPHPMFVIPPSIDPLSEKNRELSPQEIEEVRKLFDIDLERPLLLQVSRFDHFKDPLGVIEAFRYVRKHRPGVQLALAGGTASDDPEGAHVLQEVKQAAADDPDIHILQLPDEAHRLVNALQRTADVIIQKSTKEGFGLTVTEGLWKGKPVIGGNTGGIKLQVINKQTGFIVNTAEGAAYRIRYLLQHPNEGKEMGLKGREYVREKFLISRHLRDYLAVIHALMFKDQDRIELHQ